MPFSEEEPTGIQTKSSDQNEITYLDSYSKLGRLQNYCNNNFLVAISKIIPKVEKKGKFQSWVPVTGNGSLWNSKINKIFKDSQELENETPNAESFLDSIKYKLVKYYLTLCRTTATTIFLLPSV